MMNSKLCRALVVAVFVASGWGMGCSISDSSGSISDSSGSMSDSSGSSANSSESSSDGEEAAYRGDVESFTIAALDARAFDAVNTEDFTRMLGAISEAHGITDWYASAATFRAVGHGLQRAGLTHEQALGFHRRVFGSDGPREQMLMHGFREAGEIS